VRVQLHLLAPNYRPQQVTEDLASFWANTYPVVRKDCGRATPSTPGRRIHWWPCPSGGRSRSKERDKLRCEAYFVNAADDPRKM
jgi:hypothetical protein